MASAALSTSTGSKLYVHSDFAFSEGVRASLSLFDPTLIMLKQVSQILVSASARARSESSRSFLLLQHRSEWLGLLDITTKWNGEHHVSRTLALRSEQG
jgi:hypothetical protein